MTAFCHAMCNATLWTMGLVVLVVENLQNTLISFPRFKLEGFFLLVVLSLDEILLCGSG